MVTLEVSFKVRGVITIRLLSYTKALQISIVKVLRKLCVTSRES